MNWISRQYFSKTPNSLVRFIFFAAACLAMGSVALCAQTSGAEGPKPASATTQAANAAVLQELPFADKTAFELAHKGFIAPLSPALIKGKAGNTVWNPEQFLFIREGEPSPDTVNASF